MTSSGLKSEVLRTGQRRRRRTPAERLAILAATQEPGVTVSLVARPEPVIPLAAAGVAGRLDGGAIGRAGGFRFRVPFAAGASSRVAAAAGQEDDGSGDSQGSSRLSGPKKKHLLRSLSWPKDGSR